MKKTLTVLLIFLMCISLFGCGSKKEQLTYEETFSTNQAEKLFSEEKYDDFKELCKIMSGNNDDPQDRDNFFNFVALHFEEINKSNNREKFKPSLEIISECLKLPLTQQPVIKSLKTTHASIDKKLTEQSKEYIIGKWQRRDETNLNGMVMEIQKDKNGNLMGKIVSVPDADTTTFKTGDAKWINIIFANHKTIYFSDKANSEINTQMYYTNDSKTVSSYKGAIATINFDYNTMVVEYDSTPLEYISVSEQQVSDNTDEITEDDNTGISDDENSEDTEKDENEETSEQTQIMPKQVWVKI